MPRQSKKGSILKTAKLLFSEKGYDATSMDDIAMRTDIPKSLIYYHFKNKEELLNIIITEFLDEYARILQDDSERGTDKIAKYIQFIENNNDSARILLAESLKEGVNNIAIFKSVETLIKNSQSEMKSNHAHWVTEFFTSIMPSLLFVCYKENWCKYFDVKHEILTNDYLEAYKLTHGAYHEHIKQESL